MASHSGFYKGEKKKKKKQTLDQQSFGSGAPTFVLPKLVEKKKKSE